MSLQVSQPGILAGVTHNWRGLKGVNGSPKLCTVPNTCGQSGFECLLAILVASEGNGGHERFFLSVFPLSPGGLGAQLKAEQSPNSKHSNKSTDTH